MSNTQWFRDTLDAPSRVKYLLWRAMNRAGLKRDEVVVQVKGGPQILLRGRPARDLDTAYELFRVEVYRRAVDELRGGARCIVDLGANTGYALAYLAAHFPQARFIAFEPHPRLLRALYRNIQLNGLEGRVRVHPAAATTRTGELSLTDEESESTLAKRPGVRTIEVMGEDLFDALAGVQVDLLKMDIEGAEYPLLDDPRFVALKPRAIVMEWHSTDEHPDGKTWCADRLKQLGYAVEPYMGLTNRSGMIFASAQA
jgi:FkbM family methyltransferase